MRNSVEERFSFLPVEPAKQPSKYGSTEPALGDFNDILRALDLLHKSSQAFQEFMPEARKVETDFLGIVARLKINIDGMVGGQEPPTMSDCITEASISTREPSLDIMGYQIDWNHQTHVAV